MGNLIISPALKYLSATVNRLISAVDSDKGVAVYKELQASLQLDINCEYKLSDNTSLSLFISNAFNGYTEQYGRFARLEINHRY